METVKGFSVSSLEDIRRKNNSSLMVNWVAIERLGSQGNMTIDMETIDVLSNWRAFQFS